MDRGTAGVLLVGWPGSPSCPAPRPPIPAGCALAPPGYWPAIPAARRQSAMSAETDDVTSDFYDLEALLDEEDRALLYRVREFMDAEVQPIINEYWTRAQFPRQIIPGLAELGIAGTQFSGYGSPGKSALLDGMISMELSRGDPSVSTFMGVHGGLVMGSMHLCASEEQKERWLPALARLELIGAFGLTEPDSGSDVARGLRTTARRDGDSWVLNGQKKWIGNGSFADLVIVWAQDVDTQRVLGFVVEQG